MSTEAVPELLLMYGVVPLWIAAGLVDWLCHRRTRIERTGGIAENVFHWVLLAEGGVALVSAALLEIDAAVLLLVFAAFLAHELTTYVELRYAVPRREIGPFEQMVHSVMEMLPLLLFALLAVSHWDQVQALVGGGAADFSLRPKQVHWPLGYLAVTAFAVLLLNVLPMAEEGWRCLRERRREF